MKTYLECIPCFVRQAHDALRQANYETLSEANRDLFFPTQVKCPVIGRDLGKPVGSWVVQYHPGERDV